MLGAALSASASDTAATNNAVAPKAAATDTSSPGVVAVNPKLLQRRRQAIAQMLEGNVAFRGILLEREAPRISDAQLGGPFELKQRKSWFSSETITRTLYCAKAGVGIGSLPRVWRTALIQLIPFNNGTERLVAKINFNSTPYECGRAKYEPFPELEQVRAQRRRALGMGD